MTLKGWRVVKPQHNQMKSCNLDEQRERFQSKMAKYHGKDNQHSKLYFPGNPCCDVKPIKKKKKKDDWLVLLGGKIITVYNLHEM